MAARYAPSRTVPGRLYLVNETWCECPGFQYRGTCWHRKAYDEEATVTEHKDIHEAINAVMAEVDYVQKEKKATLNYSFASERAFIEALRPAMVTHGIYCHVANVIDVRHEDLPTKSGGSMQRVTLIATIRFSHVGGTSVDSWATGEGMDSGDKASNKAMTGAYKYALRQTFCIETGDDPDNESPQPASRQQRPQDAPQQPSAPPAAKPDSGTPLRTQVRAALEAANLSLSCLEPVFKMRLTDGNIDALIGKYLREPDHSITSLVEDAKAMSMSGARS